MEFNGQIFKMNQSIDNENPLDIYKDSSQHLVRNFKMPFKCTDNVEKLVDESLGRDKVLCTFGAGKKVKKDIHKVKKVFKEPEKRLPADMMVDDKKTQGRIKKQFDKQNVPKRKAAEKTIELFSHLDQSDRSHLITVDPRLMFSSRGIHPAILKLGAQLSTDEIAGSSARTVALLAAFQNVIQDYTTPDNRDMVRECIKIIEPCINFLKECSPLSLSMRNSITYMKFLLKHIPHQLDESQGKNWFVEQTKKFIQARILLAAKIISEMVVNKITNGDVILVFSPCNLVMNILLEAKRKKLNFKIVIIDSRPELGGIECARILSAQGISCSYQLLSAVTFAIKDCSLVLVSVEGLFSNGSVLANVGTSMICLVAQTYNVPVMVCCETYKFIDRVQIDSFVYNELGDSDDVSRLPDGLYGPLEVCKDMNTLRILNLKYDITPPELVDLVVTESGIIPCTSIPVIIRVQTYLERFD